MRAPGDFRKRIPRPDHTLDPGRIARGTRNHEVIVHHVMAPDAETIGDELLLRRLVVNQQDIGVAPFRKPDGLAGPDGDHPDGDPALGLKPWQDIREQARIIGRRGGCQGDEPVLRLGRSLGPDKRPGQNGQPPHHNRSPLK